LWVEFIGGSSVAKSVLIVAIVVLRVGGVVLLEHWLPALDLWLAVHHFLRLSCKSHGAYTSKLDCVCTVGSSNLFSLLASKDIHLLPKSVDPSVAYGPADRKVRRIMAREYKKTAKKVAFVTMEEARNEARFCRHMQPVVPRLA
jgi:hypothetical protein